MAKNKGDQLLLIRLSAMGDVAMTVPVLKALIRQNPKLRLLVLTRPFFKPIFDSIPNVTVFPADLKGRHKGFTGIFKLSRELKKLPIKGIADLHNVLRTNLLKLFFMASGLAFVQIDKGRGEKKRITVWKPKTISPLKSTHERYANVFRRMGYNLELTPQDVLERESPSYTVRAYLEDQNKKLIGIAPFAAFKGKMYPLKLMEKVIAAIDNTKEYNIILFGGGEREVKVLEAFTIKYTNCFNAAGKLSFADELRLISNLDLMVSMDSGNGHLAAMYGVPTITLWGITHPFAGFSPFGQPDSNSILPDLHRFPLIPTSVYGNKYPKGYENVMESIEPESVVGKIEELLDQ